MGAEAEGVTVQLLVQAAALAGLMAIEAAMIGEMAESLKDKRQAAALLLAANILLGVCAGAIAR